jgi:hypothetical protein
MSDKSAALTAAADAFRKAVSSEYELDSDFVDTLVKMFSTCAKDLCTVEAPVAKAPRKAAAKSAPAEGKPTRKKSAYNVYVRQQMSTDAIKNVPHKEKMGQIAASWKALTAEEQAEYKEQARLENEGSTETTA